jgi:hypothetical protein
MYKYRVLRDFYLVGICVIGLILIGVMMILFFMNEVTLLQLLLFSGCFFWLGFLGNFMLPVRVISSDGLYSRKQLFLWDDISAITYKENGAYNFNFYVLMSLIHYLFLKRSIRCTKFDLIISTQNDNKMSKFYINEKALSLIKQYAKCEIKENI